MEKYRISREQQRKLARLTQEENKNEISTILREKQMESSNEYMKEHRSIRKHKKRTKD